MELDKFRLISDPENVTQFIETGINYEYFIPNVISFEKYLVQILNIEGTDISDIDKNTEIKWTNLRTLRLSSKIECNEDDNNVNYCESIKLQSQPENEFAFRVQNRLRNYTGNNALEFSVDNADELTISCKLCDKDEIDYVLYSLLGVVGVSFIISVFAFLFNMGLFCKLPGFHYVDDAKWSAIMIFGLQFWDFYSDINLSLEIITRDDIFNDIFILISGWGSVCFVVVPYIANLIIASKSKA